MNLLQSLWRAMASLRDVRARISSIKSTMKITKAMQMVSVAKLKKSKVALENSKPYTESMLEMIGAILPDIDNSNVKILQEAKSNPKFLMVVFSASRGLCGGFNAAVIRQLKQDLKLIPKDKIKIICIGKKGYELLKNSFKDEIVYKLESFKNLYDEAINIKNLILELYKEDEFQVCKLYYNKFKNALSQELQVEQLIPISISRTYIKTNNSILYEPRKYDILDMVLEKGIMAKIYNAMLENTVGEHGARMTAMDNATNNANKMIGDLTLQLNRTRQAIITKELTEIIAGSEAL